MKMSLPPGWEQSVDPATGRTFYVNHNTQQTSWTPPVDSPLPAGWEERRDDHGRTFFYNVETMKTTWTDPRVVADHSNGLDHGSTSVVASYPSLSSPGATSSSSNQAEPKYQLKIPGGGSSSSTWSCPSCTFVNPKSAAACEMCQAARVGGGDNTSFSRGTSSKSNQLQSDEALAAALQADLDREASQDFPAKSINRSESYDDQPKAYQATEPFELLPNMVPDETSTKCLRCSKEFGKLVNRRHHCRCCGMLCCSECSSKKTVVRLPTQDESLNEKEQRVCDWCFDHLVEGHAHCLYRYVVVASKEQDENRELAIKGIAEIMEHLPQMLSSSSDRSQANRDLDILKFVGGVAKMCSFLSPGDPPSTQAQACRLVAAVASASCIKDLEAHLPKRLVASELCEGAALAIMSTILQRSPNSKENLSAQISAARVLYLLGDVPTLKAATREAELIPPLCDALLSSDAQLQDWSCMCLGRLMKGDRQSVEEVLKHNGIQSLVLLLSSQNAMIQEHAAVTLQEALVVDPVNQAPKVKKALSGFSGTPAALRLLQSGEAQVVSAGLRLLLVLSETEARQIRSLDGIPLLVSIVVGNGNSAESFGTELQILALQVLRNVANVGPMERQAISQCGGLSAAVTLMKSSTNSFVRKEATNLVEALSSDADGARGVMEASGGIAGLVDAVKTSDDSSFSASSALGQILLQGPEAQAAMLEAGALEALLAAGSRGDLPTACRVAEATFAFVSDPELLPKLAANVPPPTLAQRLIHLGSSLRSVLPGHIMEQLVLTLAVLCGARPSDYRMTTSRGDGEEDLPPVLKVTGPQTRALVAANGSQLLVTLVQHSLRTEPGVALASLRCMLAVAADPANGDKIVNNGGLPVVLQSMAETMRAGDAPDTSSPLTQILLHSIALFARLVGGTRPRDAGRDPDTVKKGLRILTDALDCHEPECMLTAVRAVSECSFQSGTWSIIADTALPRCIEMLLADKTGAGPGGRDPLSSSEVLRLLMDVSIITSNMSKLEVHSNAILDSGGVLALISLLSEPEDDATTAGVNALWALSESSRRCAAAIAKTEIGAVVQLLHLSETHKNKAQATRALKLVRRLAEIDAANGAQIAASGAAVDALVRLVRFEQSDDALGALCAVAAASDVLWDRLSDTSDVSSTVLILERGGASSSRIQGRACRAIASMCEKNPAQCVSEEILVGAMPTIVKLLSPIDALGADKSEAPAVDAAWALSIICQASIRDHVAETLYPAVMEQSNAMLGCIQLLMRERRLGRPKSASTAQALRAVRGLLSLTNQTEAKQFWDCPLPANLKKDDIFSALTMALDANLQQQQQPTSGAATLTTSKSDLVSSWHTVVDDICFILASFPEGLPSESYLRLSRPLTQAFDKSLQVGAFRVSCLRAMCRAIQEPSLAAAMVGSVRNVASALATEKDPSAQIETGLLLAALLKNAPNDRIVQDSVASSGAVLVLYKLLDSHCRDSSVDDRRMLKDTCRALALLMEAGGNAVKKALRACGEGDKLAQDLNELVKDSNGDEDWEENSLRDDAFRILARIASLDERREEFNVVRSACFSALVKKKCLKSAVELLGWLGTVEGEAEEDSDQVDAALLEVAFDKALPIAVRLQALQSCEYFVPETSSTTIEFPKEIFLPAPTVPDAKKLHLPALLVLERLVRVKRVDLVPIVPTLILLMKSDSLSTQVESGQVTDRASSCLYEACRKNPKMRKLLRNTEGFLKLFRGVNVYGQPNSQRLLKVLGEDFIAEKPVPPPVKAVSVPATTTTQNGSEKRPQSDEMKKIAPSSPAPPAGSPPPPPPPIKSAFPTFTTTPSPQERSSLELAMRLQQLESSSGPATSYPRPPPAMPPPSFPATSSSYLQNMPGSFSASWSCPKCTLENESSAMTCDACGTSKPGTNSSSGVAASPSRSETVIMCNGCSSKLAVPGGAPSVRCPKCHTVTNVGVKVRCQSCMMELFAPPGASQFRCSNCGDVGNVRDRKV